MSGCSAFFGNDGGGATFECCLYKVVTVEVIAFERYKKTAGRNLPRVGRDRAKRQKIHVRSDSKP